MTLLPDYSMSEREGRLLVGRSPMVQERNAVAVASVVMCGGPALGGMLWWSGGPALAAVPVMALSASAGAWMLWKASRKDYAMTAANSLLVDRPGDRIVLEGRPLCAASDVRAVELRKGDEAPDELMLVLHSPLAAGAERVLLMKGAGFMLDEPAHWIASYLQVPVQRP